jgi:DNA-binding SARP family transcriptional activator/ABC-type transport system substrate-binding protein/DNA-binding beta-propeller fold protein YncE
MEFRLLGPLEVEVEGRPLVLGSAKQRALLALLVLHPNEVVSRDRLIDELWGERPPASAQHSLEVYVSRLRKTLGPNSDGRVLVAQAGGYVLRLSPDQIDVTRFDRLLEEGRRALAAGNYEHAAAGLAEALALWRGPALGDLAYEPFARAPIERFEEQRVAALEDRIEADLALGRHASLIAELEALSASHPLRERLRGQLMLALYRSGRQSEALEAYRETRQHLMNELGIDPNPALRQLEQAILRQDPALDVRAPSVAVDDRHAPVEPTPPKRRLRWTDRSRPAVLAIALAGVLIAAVAGVVVLFAGSSEPSLHGVHENAIGILQPKSGRIIGEVLMDRTPTHVAAGAGSIWAVSPKRQSVSRIDLATGRVVQTIGVGSGPSGIAYGGGAVWVADSLDGTVSRIDPGTNTVVDKKKVGNVPLAVAAGLGSIWVTCAGDRTVVRLDARTGHRIKTITTGDVGRGIAVGGGAVWVSDDDRGRVSRIDPKTNVVTSFIPLEHGATTVAYAAGTVWVANELAGTLTRIDPRRNAVAGTIPITGSTPADLTFADGRMWVSDESGGRIVRIDPQRNVVERDVATGNRQQGAAFAAGRLWVSVQPAAVRHRGGTLNVVSVGRAFDSLDPGLGYDGQALDLLGMLYDGLTAFQRLGNPDGTKLVPDLATSLPVPSDDGRTYVFKLRRGIRYSTGQVVRPRDFRYGLERMYALHPSPGNRLSFYDGLVGAARCIHTPKHCDLSEGIVTNERSNTVTFHLVAPDPEFLQKLTFSFAAPIPAETSRRETVVPSTGPYYIKDFKLNRRLDLARNPYFREWSEAATPDGYADRIHWTFLPESAASARKAVRAVEHGRADVDFDPVPRELVHEVETEFATQVHPHPLWGATYIFLNSRVPPFDDVRVRRAVNYAANRAAALPAAAQGLGSEPACQILPPNFPGFSRYCPYTTHPDASGVWKGPDLKQARRLVAASGTTGMRVTVWVPCNQTSEGPVAAALMRSIGYRARVTNVSCDLYYYSARGLGNRRSRVQAGVSSWFADYPGASSFMEIFSCAGFAHFCDPHIKARIRRALTLPTTDPYAANQLWARIDRDMVDQAAAVPLITHKTLDFVSKRVENYESSPYPTGVLLDQLWVK